MRFFYIFSQRSIILYIDGLYSSTKRLSGYTSARDPTRAALVDSFSHHVRCAYNDLNLPECLHIAATSFIVSEVDAIHDLSPAIDFRGEWHERSIIFSLLIYTFKWISFNQTPVHHFANLFTSSIQITATLHQLTHHGRYVIYIKEQLFSETEFNQIHKNMCIVAAHNIEATNWARFTVLIDQLFLLVC